MRRSLLSALALGLLVAAPATIEARTVSNGSDSIVQLYGYSSTYDDATGAWVDVSVYATQQPGDDFIEFYRSIITPIVCEGDVPGMQYTWFGGTGAGTLVTAKSYSAASVDGTVFGETWVSTYCGYDEEMVVPTNGDQPTGTYLDVDAEFTATSSLVRTKSSSSFKIPGEYNQHEATSAVFREGDVHIVVGEDEYHGSGQLGKVTFRFHSNSK